MNKMTIIIPLTCICIVFSLITIAAGMHNVSGYPSDSTLKYEYTNSDNNDIYVCGDAEIIHQDSREIFVAVGTKRTVNHSTILLKGSIYKHILWSLWYKIDNDSLVIDGNNVYCSNNRVQR